MIVKKDRGFSPKNRGRLDNRKARLFLRGGLPIDKLEWTVKLSVFFELMEKCFNAFKWKGTKGNFLQQFLNKNKMTEGI